MTNIIISLMVLVFGLSVNVFYQLMLPDRRYKCCYPVNGGGIALTVFAWFVNFGRPHHRALMLLSPP